MRLSIFLYNSNCNGLAIFFSQYLIDNQIDFSWKSLLLILHKSAKVFLWEIRLADTCNQDSLYTHANLK